MKILIIGSEKKWAIENFYIKYLRKHGCEVDIFPAHDWFYDYYYQSIKNKLLFRLHLSKIYKKINRHLLDLCANNNYDLIWIFKGMEIFPETLDIIKNKSIKLVNYNPDNPFVFTFRGSGNKNILKSVSKFDAHFCYSLPFIKKIEEEYKIPCAWLPFAFEPSSYMFPKEEDEIKRACFIGTADSYRVEMIIEMNKAGIAMDLFGNNWQTFVKASDTLRLHPAIFKDDFNRIAPCYRLQLNIFRPQNDNSHNMRTFEMPGLGCIELAPDSYEHRLLFEKDKEIFLYNNIDEAISQTKKILELSYSDALSIRKAAQKRSYNAGYTYEQKAEQVYIWFKQILDNKFPFSNPQYFFNEIKNSDITFYAN